jgi:hypothetical protein
MVKTIESINKQIIKLELERAKLRELEDKKKEEEKNKNKLPLEKLKNYAITDISNIWGIFPFIERYCSTPEEFTISGERYVEFKDKPNIISEGFGKEERITICKSKYSREYLNKIFEIVKILGYKCYDEDITFYCVVDKDYNYKKDTALLIEINNMCFMIAPRVED